MECAPYTVFRSQSVSIIDVTVNESSLEFFSRHVRVGGLVFIRSSAIGMDGPNGAIIADPNYVLMGTERERAYHMPFPAMPCLCTIVRFNDGAGASAQLSSGTNVLSTSRAHFMLARILNAAWLGRDAATLDVAAAGLVNEILENGRCEPALANQADAVRTIRMRLNQSPSKSVSLAELSRQTYLSPFTVSRLFHQQTGIPLRRYVKRLRLRTALSVMLEGTRNLTAIASELGFYDEAHFSKAFREEFGIAPAQAFGAVCGSH